MVKIDISDDVETVNWTWNSHKLIHGENFIGWLYFGTPELFVKGHMYNKHIGDLIEKYSMELKKEDEKTTRLIIYCNDPEEVKKQKEFRENKERLEHLIAQ